MLVDSLVIGLLVAKLRGGSFESLLQVSVKGIWWVILSFVMQYTSIFFFPTWLPVIIPLSYACLLWFGWLNRTQPAFLLVFAGLLLNVLVMVCNHGRMPVDVAVASQMAPQDLPALLAGESGKHVAMSAHTHLNLLGDIFYLHAPYPHHTVLSLGDLLLSIGVFLFLQAVMGTRRTAVAGGVVHG